MQTKISIWTVVAMAAAMSAIVLGDTAGKLLMADGLSPLFIAWSRFAFGALLLGPLCGLTRADLRSFLDWRVILRAALIVGVILLILTALHTEPMANVFGGFFVGPVVSFTLSAILLREPINRARVGLLALGFVGVLLVVKPGFGMGPGMIFAVLAGVFYGSFLTASRWLSFHYRPRFLLASQLIIGAVLLTPLGAAQTPMQGDVRLWALILLSAVASGFGNYLLVMVNRSTPASVVAPLVYFQLVAATIFGYFVFGDWPDVYSLLGLAIILSSGFAGLAVAGRQLR